MLAILGRPSSWEWLLFFHLLAAFSLLGGALTVAVASLLAARRERANEFAVLKRLAFRASLWMVLPSFVALIVFGEVLRSKENAKGAWLDVAYPITYLGLIVGGLVVTWLQRRGMVEAERLAAEGVERADELKRRRSTLAAGILSPLVLAGLVVVLWLMAAKPGA